MSQGFLIWTDFHPILVGAGCLALGYVYGRHCRSASEFQADVPPASDDVCCAQSQSNTYFEDLERPCKCCVSAPAKLDAVAVGNGKASKFTRSPYLVQDAAEGFEQAERSTKRDLAHRMEKLEYTDSGAHEMRQLSSRPYFEKGYPMLEEERLLQAKTPYKKQKGSPAVKEPLCSKGKAEMGFDPLNSGRMGNENKAAAAAAASVPWSREVLHKRIDYFNNVSETTAESGRSDESRKLRLIKKKFLKVAATSKGEAAYNSTSTTSNTGGVVRSGSTSGLVELATLDHQADCSHDNNSPNSPYRISGGGCQMAAVIGETSVDPQSALLEKKFEDPETFSFGNNLPTSNNGLEGNSKDRDANTLKQPACDPNEKQENELEATAEAASAGCQLLNKSMQAELLQTASASRAPEHYVTDRCSGRSELREVPGDEVLKAEIYELLNETDCTKVSFEEIVSLLEEKLQTNLQERKAHISDLVCEVTSISKLLEKERATDNEVESEQMKATGVYNDLSRVNYASSCRHLGKLPFSYDCP